MIDELMNTECIQVGNFRLKNGNVSKYYFDMRNLIAYPKLLAKIGDALYEMMGEFDIICGIPYGALPIATYISVTYNKPLIYIRDKVKEYGMKNRIEGKFSKTDRCVLLDDVITSGGSMQEAYDLLEDQVDVVKCLVIMDRQQSKICTCEVESLLNKTDVVKYRLHQVRTKKKTKLCFSADLTDLPKLWSILDQIGEHLVICKIHYDIIPEHQKEEFKTKLLEYSLKFDFLIMEDRKFNDISQIVQKQYIAFENWVDMITVHVLVNPQVLQKLSGAIIVANMSNNTYDFSIQATEMAFANENHVIGFVSQTRIDNHFVNMTPGISLYSKNEDDQKYRTIDKVDTDIIIVGRAIYNSQNVKQDVLSLIGGNQGSPITPSFS